MNIFYNLFMDLNTLLPLRAITIRLRLSQSISTPFFHQNQLALFINSLLQGVEFVDQKQGLWFEAQESGRTTFGRNDEYYFNLFCIPSAYPLFLELLDKIRRLSHGPSVQNNLGSVFSNHFNFVGLTDYFTQKSVRSHHDFIYYDERALQDELTFWRAQTSLCLRLLSPTQLKSKHKRKGKNAFICDRGLLKCGDAEYHILNSLSRLSSEIKAHSSDLEKSIVEVSDRLFWTDNEQTLKDGKLEPFGGVLGEITLNNISDNYAHLPFLIIGQYIGFGGKRSIGLGRYRLETMNGFYKTPTVLRASSHQWRSSRISTLELACYNIARKHPYIRKYIDRTFHEEEPEIEEQLEDKKLLSHVNLHELSQKLSSGCYEASILQGVILRKPDKDPRPLAVPPLEDRIAQRAVVEIMGVDIDKLSTNRSYGYRKGKSRMNARDQILLLNRQGYKWFFEADIEDFFDLINHDEIENRLRSFFPDEPLVALIMDWVRAPVKFDGSLIERPSGFPQGSSVSPMLANLLLEDFDSDIEAEGMKLIRFADDFVIVSKNEKQAQRAAQRAESSLQELGLIFNPKKTHVGQFSDGFKFLGYSFLNGIALESKKTRKKTGKIELANVPPSSWLAKILQQEPQLVEKLNSTLDKKYRENDLSRISSTPRQKSTLLPFNELGSTVFITLPGKYLHQKNGMLEIIDSETREVISQQNWNDLNNIVIIGRHSISQHCQLAALKQGVTIHYCSSSGKYLGLTTNKQPSQEGADLWLLQLECYQNETEQTLVIIKSLIESKIHNQIEVIRQRSRHSDESEGNPISAMQRLLKGLSLAKDSAQIRGYEGQAAALYFSQIKKWIPEEFEFSTRKKRPSPDPFNALLSLGYSVLYSHTASVLQIAGLYPWRGFFHQAFGRHMALASDLMEVFRHIVDRTAMTVLRSGQLKPDDFYILPDGSCRLTQDGIRIFLRQLSLRMLKPLVDKNHPLALNMHEQLLKTANQLIRNIRNGNETVNFFKLK